MHEYLGNKIYILREKLKKKKIKKYTDIRSYQSWIYVFSMDVTKMPDSVIAKRDVFG